MLYLNLSFYQKLTLKKFFLFLVLFFFFFFGLCLGVRAEETASSKVITGFRKTDGSALETTCSFTLSVNDSEALDEILWQFLKIVPVLEDGSEASPIYLNWDYAKMLSSLGQVGESLHQVEISLPQSYQLSSTAPSRILLKLSVVDLPVSPVTIVSFADLSHRYAYAIPVGSDWQEFYANTLEESRWRQSVPCVSSEGETYYADILWENPSLDTGVPGIYKITGSVSLPENTLLEEGVPFPTLEASVSIQKDPTLEVWYADASVVYLPCIFPENISSESFTFLSSCNGGEWVDSLPFMDYNGNSICIWTQDLILDATYRFQVLWEGGETNVFSFVWKGAITDAGPVSGDRDGGDTNGTPGQTVIQPAPAPSFPEDSSSSQSPSSSPEVPSSSQPPSSFPEEEGPKAAAEDKNLTIPDSEEGSRVPLSEAPPSPEETELLLDGKAVPSRKTPSLSREASPVPEEEEPFLERITDTVSYLSGTRLLYMM